MADRAAPQVRRGAPRGDPRGRDRATSPSAATTAPRRRASPARRASRSPTCSASSAPSASCSSPAATAPTSSWSRCSAAPPATAARPEERLHAMGKAYVEELLPDRHAILMQMQGYVASSDPEIQAHVRAALGRVVAEVTRLSGADGRDVWHFFAHGMLLNVTAALDLEAIAGRERVGGRVVAGRADHRLRRHARLLMLDRLARFLDRRRRAVLVGGGRAGVRRRRVRRPGGRAARHRRRLHRPAARSRSRRATRSRGSTGPLGRARRAGAGAARRAGRHAGGRPQAAARRRARRGSSDVSPGAGARGRRAVAAALEGPALDLRGGDLLHRGATRRTRRTRCSGGWPASRA